MYFSSCGLRAVIVLVFAKAWLLYIPFSSVNYPISFVCVCTHIYVYICRYIYVHVCVCIAQVSHSPLLLIAMKSATFLLALKALAQLIPSHLSKHIYYH